MLIITMKLSVAQTHHLNFTDKENEVQRKVQSLKACKVWSPRFQRSHRCKTEFQSKHYNLLQQDKLDFLQRNTTNRLKGRSMISTPGSSYYSHTRVWKSNIETTTYVYFSSSFHKMSVLYVIKLTLYSHTISVI